MNPAKNKELPPETLDDGIMRLKKKIRSNKKQLPDNKKKMLFIHCENILFIDENDVENKIITNFSHFLDNDDNLVILALTGGPHYLGETDAITKIGSHYFVKSGNSILGGRYVILINDKTFNQISLKSRESILKALLLLSDISPLN